MSTGIVPTPACGSNAGNRGNEDSEILANVFALVNHDPFEPVPGQTRILLIRHGETAEPDRFHGGESDVGLSERGNTQALALARSLARAEIRAVYTSPMQRAWQTAAALSAVLELEAQVVEALREARLGILSERSKREGTEAFEDLLGRWADGDLDFRTTGGESYRELETRIRAPILEMAARHCGGAIAVVTHGMVIRLILSQLARGFSHADCQRLRVATGSLSTLQRDEGDWVLTALNVRPPKPRTKSTAVRREDS